jgi:ankyrin repeat protein
MDDDDGWLALAEVVARDIWTAARQGDREEVKRMVGQYPNLLNATEKYGKTPLMVASREGHAEIVRWFLDKGAAMNGQNQRGETALSLASLMGRTPVVTLLVERGADPTIASHDRLTPLMAASRHDNLEVLRVLLDHPSAQGMINHRDRHGQTALWHACHWGYESIVRALLASGADPTIATESGSTPMAIAIVRGRLECIAALEVRFPSSLCCLRQHLRF